MSTELREDELVRGELLLDPAGRTGGAAEGGEGGENGIQFVREAVHTTEAEHPERTPGFVFDG